MQNELHGVMTAIRGSQMLRLLLIGFLVLLLLIPAAMIGSLVSERSATRQGAVEEVTAKWGKLQIMTGVAAPRLYAPPPAENDPRQPTRGIGVWRFPEWFIVQEAGGSEEKERSRRLVHRISARRRHRTGYSYKFHSRGGRERHVHTGCECECLGISGSNRC